MQESFLASDLGRGATFRRFTISYLDLQAIVGSGAKTITLFTLPINGIMLGVRQTLVNNFLGGSLSAMTTSVGKSGSATFFTATLDVFQAESDTTLQETALFKHGQVSALPVIVTITPTGDSVSVATQGQVDIDVFYNNVTTDSTQIP